MALLDMFRPKWRHSDEAVREDALRTLGSDDLQTVVEIAESDPSPRIRRLALSRIENPEVLERLLHSEPDHEVKKAASDQAQAAYLALALSETAEQSGAAIRKLIHLPFLARVARQAPLPASREAALSQIQDEELLATLARSTEDVAIRRLAAERISSEHLIRDLALTEPSKEHAVALVARLTDPASLEAVAMKANMKVARKAARDRLEQGQDSKAENAAAGAEVAEAASADAPLEKICATIAALPGELDWTAAETAYNDLKMSWRALGGAAGNSRMQKAFGRASEQFEGRQERQRAALVAARKALCDRLEAARGAGVGEVISEVSAQWDALAVLPARHQEDLDERYRRALRAASSRHEEARRTAELGATLEQLCAEAEALDASDRSASRAMAGLRERWNSATQGVTVSPGLAQRFSAVEQRVEASAREEGERRAEEQRVAAAALTTALDALERVLELQDMKAVRLAMKDAVAAFKHPGDVAREKLAALERRFAELGERVQGHLAKLQHEGEWQRWSNVNMLEQLCTEAAALREQAGAAEAIASELLKELKALQNRWKQVGPATREQSRDLWDRFKATCDEVYAACQQRFAAIDEERKENLQKKEKLCEEVEALGESCEWKEAADRIKAAQEEWKAIGPVPKAKSDAIWRRFRAACDHFFARRDGHYSARDADRHENARILTSLCERAEAVTQSTDWKETADALKALQAEWKLVGPAPKEESEALWKRFRTACDAFFQGREAHFADRRAELDANYERKQEIIAQIVALAAGDLDTAAMERAKALQLAWREVGPVPRETMDEQRARFKEVCDRFFDSYRNRDRVAARDVLSSIATEASRFRNRMQIRRRNSPDAAGRGAEAGAGKDRD
ncbi:MAG: DUF349 domain-containing protein [Candidatus Schekmanbacteria bacterium]|nr:DUF349 domain-containing protein [Candidatus Schekmanbacteria bacterium]